MNDYECHINFRYRKEKFELRESFNIPEEKVCCNNVPADGIEALYVYLHLCFLNNVRIVFTS